MERNLDFDFCGKHQVFVNLKKEYEEITVTCTSPSKTFNLAGLQLSNIFIANPQLKKGMSGTKPCISMYRTIFILPKNMWRKTFPV